MAPLIKRAARCGGILALLIAVVCGIASVPINDRLFHDNTWLFAALLTTIAMYSAAYLGREGRSGNGRFGAYGVMLGSEGLIRVVTAIVLVVVGCTTRRRSRSRSGCPPGSPSSSRSP